MPEVKPRDYTTGELNAAADFCRDAADLLAPTADELTRIAESLEPERADDALHLRRTSRDLLGGALHLTVGERTIRRVIRDIGRTYAGISSLFNRCTYIASFAGSTLLVSYVVLPEHVAHILMGEARLPYGFALGMSTANLIMYRRTRRPHPDR